MMFRIRWLIMWESKVVKILLRACCFQIAWCLIGVCSSLYSGIACYWGGWFDHKNIAYLQEASLIPSVSSDGSSGINTRLVNVESQFSSVGNAPSILGYQGGYCWSYKKASSSQIDVRHCRTGTTAATFNEHDLIIFWLIWKLSIVFVHIGRWGGNLGLKCACVQVGMKLPWYWRCSAQCGVRLTNAATW